MSKFDHRVKLLMLGNSSVGKSSILLRFADDKFKTEHVVTLGVEFKQKILQIQDQKKNNKKIQVQVWDTAGQERFRTITPVYYRSVEGVVLAFDLTDSESFSSIDYWVQNISSTIEIENLNIILVGNKSDKEGRQVSKEDAEKIAEKYGFPYYETSAKTGENIDEIFIDITKQIMKNQQSKSNNNSLKPQNSLTDNNNGEMTQSQQLKPENHQSSKSIKKQPENKKCC